MNACVVVAADVCVCVCECVCVHVCVYMCVCVSVCSYGTKEAWKLPLKKEKGGDKKNEERIVIFATSENLNVFSSFCLFVVPLCHLEILLHPLSPRI